MFIVRQIMNIIPNDYTYLYRIVVHTNIKMFIMLRDENNSVQLYNVLIRRFFFFVVLINVVTLSERLILEYPQKMTDAISKYVVCIALLKCMIKTA